MNSRVKSFTVFLITMCLFTALFTGCNIRGRSSQTPNQAQNTRLGQNMNGSTLRPGTGTLPNGSNTGMQGTTNTPGATQLNQQITQTLSFDTKRADNIKNHLTSMREIQNPHVVVNGNTAIVGYKLSNTVKDAKSVKKMLETKIKQSDKLITNVMSTDSNSITSELSKLTSEIKSNKPINELGNRFTRIMQNFVSPGTQQKAKTTTGK